MTTFPGSASVPVGEYSLEVATHAGSFAQFDPEQESENAEELRTALANESEQPPAVVGVIEEFEESADAVTGRIEQAEKYLRAAASGELLQFDHLSGEIDGLLDLFARLDKAGRFEEELKLMRSLNGLLALSLRWLDLIRSLRSLLSSAQAAGHKAGQAFAHHELGSLHLCVGHSEQAAQHFGKALRLQDQIGDLTGRCATRHNLDSAHRDLALQARAGRPPRRLLRSAELASAFVLLGGGGGSAIALAVHSNHHRSATTTQPRSHIVTVKFAGGGTGIVSGGGMDCPGDCTTSVEEGRTVTLRATADKVSRFVRWEGVDCRLRRRTCKQVVQGKVTATAVFFKRRTPIDTQAPKAPTDLRATAVSNSEIDLSWSASTDNVAVTGYVVYRDGVELGTQVPGTTTVFRDTDLAPSTGHVYSVQAVDAAKNRSPQSNQTKATTKASPDTQPPSTPTGLSARAVSSSEIDIAWTASIDNVAVTSYVIYRDGQVVATVSGTETSFDDPNLNASTTYRYNVQALDSAGNPSGTSKPAEAMTGPG